MRSALPDDALAQSSSSSVRMYDDEVGLSYGEVGWSCGGVGR